jgi:V-type H+-transporting ATPase subunit C
MQAFSAWIHICAIRLFVESILRYGLPPQFLPVLMKPHQKSTAKLRKLLASVFGSAGECWSLFFVITAACELASILLPVPCLEC